MSQENLKKLLEAYELLNTRFVARAPTSACRSKTLTPAPELGSDGALKDSAAPVLRAALYCCTTCL